MNELLFYFIVRLISDRLTKKIMFSKTIKALFTNNTNFKSTFDRSIGIKSIIPSKHNKIQKILKVLYLLK